MNTVYELALDWNEWIMDTVYTGVFMRTLESR
jgi:hypothetical protein